MCQCLKWINEDENKIFEINNICDIQPAELDLSYKVRLGVYGWTDWMFFS